MTGKMNRRDLGAVRRCGNMNSTASNDTKKLMRELQHVDFSIIETILYLDAYPCSAEALDYYHKLCAERNRLQALLNQSGHPITAQENHSKSEWNWVKGPWPWEIEAN